MVAWRRTRHVTSRIALVLIAGFTLAACGGSSPTPTRMVGAHRIALVVPADWTTDRRGPGVFCAPTDPGTVEFFSPLRPGTPVGSCVMKNGESSPAQDSVSVYTRSSGGVGTPHHATSGTVHDLPYYISDSRQAGPGVAMTLSVPGAGVSFLVGAADRDRAMALLATIRFVPAGTRLR